jgi:hypothetical protein
MTTDETPLPGVAERFVRRIESLLTATALICFRRSYLVLSAVVVVSFLSVLVARQRLSLNADLAELLPPSFQSVQDLELLKERYGGVGYVGVIASNADPDALRRFVDDLAPRVEALESVRFVDHERPTRFFRDHSLYYMDIDDLQVLHDRLRARLDHEITQRNPMMLDFDDEPAPPVEIADLEKKYQDRSDHAWMRAQLDDDYYIDPQGRRIALLAKPAKMSTDLAFSRQIVSDIKQVVETIDLASYDPNMRVEFGGNFTKKVDQQDMIEGDLQIATSAALGLMLLYLLLHFRRFGAVALIMGPLLAGLTWVFGFVAIAYAQLNILTGFIGAILLGLGIDHGIHLLGRFRETWSSREAAEQAVSAAFGNTGRAVLIAAATTAVGFAGLGISEFRAFREFGIIASIGLMMVVLAYMTCLPALLGLAVRAGWQPRATADRPPSRYARALARHPGLLFAAFATLLLVAIPLSSRLEFNTNFRALTASNLPSFQLDSVIDGLLGHSQTPVVVLTDNRDQSRLVAETLRQRKAQTGAESTIHMVATGDDVLPGRQQEKRAIIEKMRKIVDRLSTGTLAEEDREGLERLQRLVAAEPFSKDDLPDSVGRMFFSEHSGDGDFVLAYSSKDLSDGANVSRFAKEVRGIELPGGRHASAAGEAMVLADIFNLVMREGPPVLGGTVLMILLTMWVMIGNLRRALMAIFPAAASLIITFALLPLFGIELNYLNIVMIPVLVGTGVDGGVHLVTRAADRSIPKAADHASIPIFGALVTTALGFSTLMTAHHLGLNSLGELAAVGLSANLLACLLGLPTLLILIRRWRQPT